MVRFMEYEERIAQRAACVAPSLRVIALGCFALGSMRHALCALRLYR